MPNELILIVEDNDKNQKLLRDLLQFHGYCTVEASTAEEGLDLVREQTPALILMDLQLPGMDGIAAFKRLRADARSQHIPVIAVTASARPEDRLQAVGVGFDGYVTKPIAVQEFAQLVHDILRPPPRTEREWP